MSQELFSKFLDGALKEIQKSPVWLQRTALGLAVIGNVPLIGLPGALVFEGIHWFNLNKF